MKVRCRVVLESIRLPSRQASNSGIERKRGPRLTLDKKSLIEITVEQVTVQSDIGVGGAKLGAHRCVRIGDSAVTVGLKSIVQNAHRSGPDKEPVERIADERVASHRMAAETADVELQAVPSRVGLDGAVACDPVIRNDRGGLIVCGGAANDHCRETSVGNAVGIEANDTTVDPYHRK